MAGITAFLYRLLMRPFIEEGRFMFFMYLLGAVCIIFEPWNSLRHYALLELVSDVYLLTFLLSLLPHTWRQPAKILAATTLYVIAFIDNVFYVSVNSPLSTPLLRAVLNTTAREAGEAVHAFANWKLLWSQLPLILFLAVAHIYCTVRPVRFYIPHRALVLCVTILITFISFLFSCDNKRYLFHRLMLRQADTELPQAIMDMTIRTGYYLPVYRWWQASIELQRHLHAVHTLHKAQRHIPVKQAAPHSPHITLIIGESLNRHHLSLYNYPLPTTPRLQERKRQGELTVFTNVITPWNFTTEALEHMLSLQCYGDKGEWYEQPLFTSLFKKAGYDVSFISNQYILKPKKTESFMDTQLLNNPQLSSLQFHRRNNCTHTYDEGLLQDYDSLAKLQTSPSLTIVHLLGQHVEFADRFPPAHRHFKPNRYNRPDLTPVQRSILADYDNAVLYGDSVTDALLQREKRRESIVIFVSDHGERVFDYNTQQYGRSNGLSQEDVHQQYDVVMWLWVSPALQKLRPDLSRLLKQAANVPFSTDRLAHLMIGLAGLETPLYHPDCNPLEGHYNAKIPRLIRGLYNYDSLYGKP